MGRPVKKINFGPATTTASAPSEAPIRGIIVSAFIPVINGGSSAVTGYIRKQTGSRSYKVTTAQGTGRCKLVASASAAGEVTMVGFDGGTTVAIKKLTQHIATDFSGNRYHWVLVNDSSVDYIQLTAI